MAEKSITIKLRAKLFFKAALSRAGRLLKGFAGRVKGFTKSVAGGIKNVTAALAGMATGIATGFAKLARMEARQAVGQAKLAAVLRSTGFAAGFTRRELNDQAAAMQESQGVADDLTTGVQTMLATFKQVKGDNFVRATKAVQDMATVMEEGMATQAGLKAASIQLGKALNDPIKGIGALSRVGIQFTEDQKALIKTLVDSGDVAAAQNVILKEVESQFGGAAAAASKADFGISKLTNTMSDAGEAMGKALAEASGLEGVLESLRNRVRGLIESGQFQIWAEDAVAAFKAVREIGADLAKALKLDVIARAAQTGLQKVAAFAGAISGAQGTLAERLRAGVEAAKEASPEALQRGAKCRPSSASSI
jgi:hypothetical protein